MLNMNMDEHACRVVYLSETPPESQPAQMFFEDYPDLLTPTHLSEITGQYEATGVLSVPRGSSQPCVSESAGTFLRLLWSSL